MSATMRSPGASDKCVGKVRISLRACLVIVLYYVVYCIHHRSYPTRMHRFSRSPIRNGSARHDGAERVQTVPARRLTDDLSKRVTAPDSRSLAELPRASALNSAPLGLCPLGLVMDATAQHVELVHNLRFGPKREGSCSTPRIERTRRPPRRAVSYCPSGWVGCLGPATRPRMLSRIARRCYARGASDPWMKVKQLPDATLSALADVLEIRAADPIQANIRETVLTSALKHAPVDAAVCEIGCGTGAVSRHIASLPGVGRVVGVDPSPSFLSRARAIVSPVEYVSGFGSALPLPGTSQDVVVLWTLLAHVPADATPQVLSEARRVLKPGGSVVLFDNDVCAWTFGMQEMNDPMQRAVDALTQAYITDPFLSRKFPTLLQEAGFTPGTLSIHPTVAVTEDSHGYGLVQRGIELMLSSGQIEETEADMFRAEAKRRVAEGRFNGLVTYGSCIGTR